MYVSERILSRALNIPHGLHSSFLLFSFSLERGVGREREGVKVEGVENKSGVRVEV